MYESKVGVRRQRFPNANLESCTYRVMLELNMSKTCFTESSISAFVFGSLLGSFVYCIPNPCAVHVIPPSNKTKNKNPIYIYIVARIIWHKKKKKNNRFAIGK